MINKILLLILIQAIYGLALTDGTAEFYQKALEPYYPDPDQKILDAVIHRCPSYRSSSQPEDSEDFQVKLARTSDELVSFIYEYNTSQRPPSTLVILMDSPEPYVTGPMDLKPKSDGLLYNDGYWHNRNLIFCGIHDLVTPPSQTTGASYTFSGALSEENWGQRLPDASRMTRWTIKDDELQNHLEARPPGAVFSTFSSGYLTFAGLYMDTSSVTTSCESPDEATPCGSVFALGASPSFVKLWLNHSYLIDQSDHERLFVSIPHSSRTNALTVQNSVVQGHSTGLLVNIEPGSLGISANDSLFCNTRSHPSGSMIEVRRAITYDANLPFYANEPGFSNCWFSASESGNYTAISLYNLRHVNASDAGLIHLLALKMVNNTFDKGLSLPVRIISEAGYPPGSVRQDSGGNQWLGHQDQQACIGNVSPYPLEFINNRGCPKVP